MLVVEELLTTQVFFPGTIVFEEGAPPTALYFVAAGQVTADVLVGTPRRRVRVSAIGAGQAFGDLAVLDGRPRSSRIVIDEPTLCHVLTLKDFVALQATHPDISASIYRALALTLSSRLRRTNDLLRALLS